jgi:homoserine dehydrogenase
MRQRKDFISANKKMIAENLQEIIRWNINSQSTFLYEASVAGSIPILRNLDVYFKQKKNQKLTAILNGSSNYILSKMFNGQCSYQSALSKAQELGFAESDPKADVAGLDAKYKAVILATHAFGFLTTPDEVKNFGIQNISQVDVLFAQSRNLCIKQVATILQLPDNKMRVTVMPQFVAIDCELGKTDNEDNIIQLTNNNTDYIFKGAGAGGIATGTAILADLHACEEGYGYHYTIDDNLRLSNDFQITVYLNKKNLNTQFNAVILEETDNYIIININYKDLIKLKLKNVFVGQILPKSDKYEKK